jgi:four helix bundle protein
MVASHKELDVRKKAIGIAESSYLLTSKFPRDEQFGLTSQIRRAAVSIAANIAEGYGRDQIGNYVQFLRVSLGSARELDTYIVIAIRVGILSAEAAAPLVRECDDVCRMLHGLIRSLQMRRNA